MKNKTILLMLALGLNLTSPCSQLRADGKVAALDMAAAPQEEQGKQTADRKNKAPRSLWSKLFATTGTVTVVVLVGLYGVGSLFPRAQKDVDSDDDTVDSAHTIKTSSVRVVSTQDIDMDIDTDEENEDDQQALNIGRRVGARIVRGAKICSSAMAYAAKSIGLKSEPIVVRSSYHLLLEKA